MWLTKLLVFYKAFTDNQNHIYSLAKCYYACQNPFRVTHGSAPLHCKAASDLIGRPTHGPMMVLENSQIKILNL